MKLDTDIHAFNVEPLAYYLLKNLIPFTSIYPQNTLNQIAILLKTASLPLLSAIHKVCFGKQEYNSKPYISCSKWANAWEKNETRYGVVSEIIAMEMMMREGLPVRCCWSRSVSEYFVDLSCYLEKTGVRQSIT